jgi:hypothetical protein
MTRSDRRRPRGLRRRPLFLHVVFSVIEMLTLRQRSGRIGGNVVVRCRQGHLFTTIWIPGASLKAARLGWWRFQRCPVGRHWTLVTPVRESELTEDERRIARETRDVRIP